VNECERFQTQLGEYLLGGLSAPDRAAFERHATQCPKCSKELTATRAALAAVDRAGLGSAPAGVAEAVAGGFAGKLRAGVRPRVRFGWLGAAAAAACLAIAALGLWLGTRAPTSPAAAKLTNEQLDAEAQAVEAHARAVLRQLDELTQEYEAVSRMTGGRPGPEKGDERTEGPAPPTGPRRAKS
jgi:anti-sigma factor RsiW